MTGDVFVDTNVLVYDQDVGERTKQPQAHRWLTFLWRQRRGRLSTQILSEYYVTVTRKLSPARPADLAREDVRDLLAWRPIPLDDRVLVAAWDADARYSISWWDALVVAAAKIGGCRYLLTEDLQDGQDLDGLVVVDPFRHDLDAVD